ncbi:OmpH family outer membrane protein [Oxalobacter vibrioformis]|uniref:OmpH family outer membrane protein n=1 Tax=Oxalobacter vibrioformis TaxID=933080 RepID=A0A9E9M167_9BURK|nr:OmpH family outer membrane protein [Oxalobacter vibrioformis]WAW11272.1 OmpH family outer membrane protein [Oxalobacter vibrioformis]
MALCLFAFAASHAQEVKIGFVNSERIMRESAPAKSASAKLEAEFSKREKELRDMQNRLKAMSDKLEKDMPVLAESDRIKRQRELADYGQDFQSKNRRYREDLMQRRNEEFAAVLDRINKVINNIAQSEKYDLIVQDAVYFSPKVDLTEKVLRALGSK